jgi:hypothetical protein
MNHGITVETVQMVLVLLRKGTQIATITTSTLVEKQWKFASVHRELV